MNINEIIRSQYLEKDDSQLAKELGLTPPAVRSRRRRMGLIHQHPNEKGLNTNLSPEEGVERDRVIKSMHASKAQTDKKYKTLLSKVEVLEKEISALSDIKENKSTFTIKPKKDGKDGEATAIWLASDWHVGEKVTYGQTNGINEYNPTTSKERGRQYFQHALALTNMMGRDVQIDTVVMALLGDFITGHLHLDAIENNYMAPVEETLYAKEIIASGIQFVLDNSKYSMVIPCASGNHGRTTKFSHFGSENGHSLEYFMYVSLRDQFRNEPRVKFVISEGAHTYVDIYDYTVRFLHGHDMKFGGGVGGLTVPVNKALAQWDKAKKAYLTCFGHFHQRFDGGNFLANGSMIGYNAFALSIKASAEAPAQQMCLIDRKRGKTLVAPILFTI